MGILIVRSLKNLIMGIPSVIPAQAGIQKYGFSWTPACAGVTGGDMILSIF